MIGSLIPEATSKQTNDDELRKILRAEGLKSPGAYRPALKSCKSVHALSPSASEMDSNREFAVSPLQWSVYNFNAPRLIAATSDPLVLSRLQVVMYTCTLACDCHEIAN